MSTNEFNKKLLSLESILNNFALSLVKNVDDAKDLVQETFLKAIKYKDKYTSGTNIKAWLFAILRNTYLNQITKLSSKNTINDETEGEYILRNTLYEMENAESKINTINIYEAIENLDDEYKMPFKMFLEGFKYKEISAISNLPMGTIKSKIFFARRILMENLHDYK